jgi:hypothetical protein
MRTHGGYDYDAMMNALPGGSGTNNDSGVTTTDGSEVILNVSRAFYRDPGAPRWQISIVTEDVEDPQMPRDVAGHECRCGALHEHAGCGEDVEVITLAADAAVRLAHKILRLAEPLMNETP